MTISSSWEHSCDLYSQSVGMLRRYKNHLQLLALMILLGFGVRYFYLDHQDLSMKVKAGSVRHHELMEERNSFSRQLDVIVQSKADIEYALKTKERELSKSKEECHAAKEKLVNDANKLRSKSLTSYKSLDTEYQMLKAQKDKLKTDHIHLQQSFDRLKADHSNVKSNYNKNMDDLKSKNERVVASLQAQIERLQKGTQSLQKRLSLVTGESVQQRKVNKETPAKISPQHLSDVGDVGARDEVLTERKVVEPRHKRSVSRKTQRTVPDGDTHVDDKVFKKNNNPGQHSQLNEARGKSPHDHKLSEKKQSVPAKNLAAKNFQEPGVESKQVEKKKDLAQDYKLKEMGDESFKAGRIGADIGENNDEAIERPFNGDDERMEGEEMRHVNRPAMVDLNNDQKFADNDEVALQEAEDNDDNAAEGENKNNPVNKYKRGEM